MSNSRQYDELTDKFKDRHTPDDCFTLPNVYAVVLDWAAKRYGFDKAKVVRPFCPGGDYQAFPYAPDAVVVDNPPFSICRQIVEWYNERGVRYFLFCNGLTAFRLIRDKGATVISVGTNVMFDNGAIINVDFVTNMAGDLLFETAFDLRDALEEVNRQNVRMVKKHVAKCRHPPEIITAARLQYLAAHHTAFKVKKSEAMYISRLDCGCRLYGDGFLLSEKAAAEKAAAEKAAAENAADKVLRLSPREKALQRSINNENT